MVHCEMGDGSQYGNEGGCSENSRSEVDGVGKPRGVACRDFLRSICRRGATCKFSHPESRTKAFSFCHDFQNGECRRSNICRFIHSSREDEMHYRRTGELPPHLVEWYEKKCILTQDADKGGVPLCKEYLWSKCWRENCKFRHIHMNEYQILQRRTPSPPLQMRIEEGSCGYDRRRPVYDNRRSYPNEIFEPEVKRRRLNFVEDMSPMERTRQPPPIYENGDSYGPRSQPDRVYIMLEEENIMLRTRVGELKKRVDDLQATNEFLLEQNAQLRMSDKSATAGLTTVTVPAVTITNTPQMQQAPTPQQMVSAAIRTVTASVATVPVSLAAVTPVSIAAVSMAPMQQIPPPIVTMAQQGAPPPSNPQGPIAISASTAPSLVSYPIMSRPVIQTDLRR